MRRGWKLAVAAGAAFLLLVMTGGVALLDEAPPMRRQAEAPEYPLEFPTDVFESPEPLPQQFQPIEVGEPEEPPSDPPVEPAPAGPPG